MALLQTNDRAAAVKRCSKEASVLLGFWEKKTLRPDKAFVHAALRIGEVEVRVHADELRGSDLLKATSPAD